MVTAPRRQAGFTIVEILVGFFVLAVAFVSLGAYTNGQRQGLHKSNQLSDGTQAAVSALEEMKRELADSAAFAGSYRDAGHGALTIDQGRILNGVSYAVRLTVTRGPAADYLLKVRARATWKGAHSVELGVLVPGAAAGT